MGFAEEIAKIEMIEGLERALDKSWERLRENARAQWESQFAGPHPSDSCVTVRVSAAEAQALPMPCAGFLVKPASSGNAKMQPRLA